MLAKHDGSAWNLDTEKATRSHKPKMCPNLIGKKRRAFFFVCEEWRKLYGESSRGVELHAVWRRRGCVLESAQLGMCAWASGGFAFWEEWKKEGVDFPALIIAAMGIPDVAGKHMLSWWTTTGKTNKNVSS